MDDKVESRPSPAFLENQYEKARRDFQIDDGVYHVAQGIHDYLSNPTSESERQIVHSLQNITRHWAESGGRGSEALTRLQGAGFIDSPPRAVTNIHDDQTSNLQLADIDGKPTIKAVIYFYASLPDYSKFDLENDPNPDSSVIPAEGVESRSSGDAVLCKAKLNLQLPPDAQNHISEYKKAMEISRLIMNKQRIRRDKRT